MEVRHSNPAMNSIEANSITLTGMLPHLLFTGLPTAFSGTSPYVLLPFYTPKAVAEILKGNKVIDQYDLKVSLLISQ